MAFLNGLFGNGGDDKSTAPKLMGPGADLLSDPREDGEFGEKTVATAAPEAPKVDSTAEDLGAGVAAISTRDSKAEATDDNNTAAGATIPLQVADEPEELEAFEDDLENDALTASLIDGASQAPAPAPVAAEDEVESTEAAAPTLAEVHIGFWKSFESYFNAKAGYNATASAHYDNYEARPNDMSLDAAFSNWLRSAQETQSGTATSELIRLYEKEKVFLAQPKVESDETEQFAFQLEKPTTLFEIVAASDKPKHWNALVDAFKIHLEAASPQRPESYKRTLLTGAVLARILHSGNAKADEVFGPILKGLAQDLITKVESIPEFAFQEITSFAYYQLKFVIDPKEFASELTANNALFRNVLMHKYVAQDERLDADVRTQILTDITYRKEYVEAAGYLSQYLNGTLPEVSSLSLTLMHAQYYENIAMELKKSEGHGDIDLQAFNFFIEKLRGDGENQMFAMTLAIINNPLQRESTFETNYPQLAALFGQFKSGDDFDGVSRLTLNQLGAIDTQFVTRLLSTERKTTELAEAFNRESEENHRFLLALKAHYFPKRGKKSPPLPVEGHKLNGMLAMLEAANPSLRA